MNTTIARWLPSVLLPLVLVAGAVGCHHGSNADGTVVALTPAVDRDAPIVPEGHRDLAYYSARTQGEEQTRVFVRRHPGDAPRVVYVDAQPGELVSVSADGTHGIFRRFISPGATEDVVIDLQKTAS
ncbi:hypothetical protein [Pendulispora albinea]|uniref:Uncharacterized protein n=1 Tax=Pendulispora albinea TaxID=2741071 RepID=A0ABZ2M6Q2_9BACT